MEDCRKKREKTIKRQMGNNILRKIQKMGFRMRDKRKGNKIQVNDEMRQKNLRRTSEKKTGDKKRENSKYILTSINKNL